jgi:hypothetical protein
MLCCHAGTESTSNSRTHRGFSFPSFCLKEANGSGVWKAFVVVHGSWAVVPSYCVAASFLVDNKHCALLASLASGFMELCMHSFFALVHFVTLFWSVLF